MGGKSSSSSKTENINKENTINLVDYSEEGSGSNVVVAESDSQVSITNTDQGAIDAGRDIALASIDYGGNLFDKAIGSIKETTSQAVKAVEKSTRDASEESLTQFMKVAAVVVLGGGVLMVAMRKK